MTVLCTLEAEFSPGVLLVMDVNSTELIPPWSSPGELVTSAESVAAIRVRHADDGPVRVRVLDAADDARGTRVFDGELLLLSGSLSLTDALGANTTEINVHSGRIRLEVYVNDLIDPFDIDLIVHR